MKYAGVQYLECEDFDARFGVETESLILVNDLKVQSPNAAFANRYATIPPGLLRMALEDLEINPAEFAFIDLGSGKGRILLLAAAAPFKRIVGVEFSPELHRVAQQNLKRYRGPRECRDISAVNADAACYEFPPEPCVIFMFDPFKGPVMHRVLTNLRQSVERLDRRVLIIFVNPHAVAEVEIKFAQSYGLQVLKNKPEYRIYKMAGRATA